MKRTKRSRAGRAVLAGVIALTSVVGISYGQWTRTPPSVRLQYNTDNVGIGIQVPTAKLHVRDTTTAAGTKIVFLGQTMGTSCLPALRLTDGTTTRTVLGLRTGDISVDNSGNIGIGTNLPGALLQLVSDGTSGSPGAYPSTHRLQVLSWAGNGPSTDNGIALLDVNAGRIATYDSYAANAYLVRVDADDKLIFAIKGNGNLGVGTAIPASKIEISGAAGANELRITNTTTSRNSWIGHDGNGPYWRISNNGDVFQIREASGNSWMTIVNGSIGIGTVNPGSYKLAVNGVIKAKEVVVTQTGWSDFVFKDDYKLKPLEKVAEYVKKNKHLEGIPTEAEVKKNGISVGEMQAKLLQKVEELTLHMIAMKKENDELKAKVGELERRVSR